jgi:hypothetical protein
MHAPSIQNQLRRHHPHTKQLLWVPYGTAQSDGISVQVDEHQQAENGRRPNPHGGRHPPRAACSSRHVTDTHNHTTHHVVLDPRHVKFCGSGAVPHAQVAAEVHGREKYESFKTFISLPQHPYPQRTPSTARPCACILHMPWVNNGAVQSGKTVA